jgi:alpha-tubulin suppressor-like RCC1 family protein
VGAAVLTASGMAAAIASPAAAATPHEQLYAWGVDSHSQLGNVNASGSTPSPLVKTWLNGTQFAKVTAGYDFGLALTTGGDVWGWGNNELGQLGGGPDNYPFATQVPNLPSGIKDIAAGSGLSMAVTQDAQVVWWGATFQEVPQVNTLNGPDGDPLENAVAVSTFYDSLILDSTGHLYSWSYATGGNATLIDLDEVAAMSAGQEHQLAVTRDGEIFAWGDNSYGQLGNPQAGSSSSTPVKVSMPTLEPNDLFIDVAAIGGSSLAITELGRLYAWGSNEFGQLGLSNPNGTPKPQQDTPQLVTDLLDETVAAVAGTVRPSHTLVLTWDGEVHSFGANNEGQLGLGSTDSDAHPKPTLVPGTGPSPNTPYTEIAAGPGFSVAVGAPKECSCS